MSLVPPVSRRASRAVAHAAAESTPERRHIALIGLMGCGKTSVGRRLAERAGMTFVDLDELIVSRQGQSITEIFRAGGEVAFRAFERAALREVLEQRAPTLIAAGGGTFVDGTMRSWLLGAARVVFLKASPKTLLGRIGEGDERLRRPLLSGPDPMAAIERLLATRAAAYEQADFAVGTDGCTIDEVVDELVRTLRLGSLPERPGRRLRPPHDEPAARQVAPREGKRPEGSASSVDVAGGSYVVELHDEAGAWLIERIAALLPQGRLAILTDDNVAPLHAQPLLQDLLAQGRQVTLHRVAPGEGSKSLTVASRIYDELSTAGLDRHDALLAVGGGVVGDLGGFVASTYMRGIGLLQIPTTTLAAVDASVGGKTALNTPRGKNLVGTFYRPRGVLVSLAHLATQNPRLHVAGLIEAFKMALALDADVFATFERDARALRDRVREPLLLALREAIGLKAQVVSADEHEQGLRAVLNLGHTIGHAIEAGEGFRLLHGEAVALGMVAELEWAESEKLSQGVLGRLIALLEALELPTDWRSYRVDLDAMRLDKKKRGASVRLPIVTQVGAHTFQDVPQTTLVSFVQQGSQR